MEVKELLEKWHLGHLWPIFQENKVDDIEVLRNLGTEEIGFLTGNILGDRIRLRSQLERLRKRPIEDVLPEHVSPEDVSPKRKKDDLAIELESENIEPENSGIENIPVDLNESIENSIENIPIYIQQGCLLPLENNEFESDKPSTSKASTLIWDSDFTIASTSNLENFSENLELKNIFEHDLFGQALIAKSKSMALSNLDRDRIADLVVSHAINKFKKLDHEHFRIMSRQLIELFPMEKQTSYFIEPIKKNESKKNRSERARGKLIEKYRNKLHLLRSLSSMTPTKLDDLEEAKDITENDVTQEARDSQIWLRNNNSPQCDVMHHWRLSFPLRKISNGTEIQQHLENWPILKGSFALDLINYDFEKIHQTNNIDIQSKFEDMFGKVYNVRKAYLNTSDETIYSLLGAQELSTDSKNAIKLHLLASLIPCKGRTRITNKKQWKPSIPETRDSVFVLVKSPGDVEQIKNERVNIMFNKGLTVQPYILLIGPTLANIVSCLVIINNIDYKCQSVIEAIDFCFKSFHVLDANYPFESSHIWYLIQWEVYNLKTKSDPHIPISNEFI